MKFADIPFHDHIKERLTSLVDSGRMPHALLISGPEGTGKLALARALAQYMQCTNRHGSDSCGVCPSCVQHQSLNHADMHYIFPVLKKKSEGMLVSADYMSRWHEFLHGGMYASLQRWLDTIDAGNSRPAIFVEEAAGLLRVVNMSAYTSPVKVVLMWLPEKLIAEAANKLLKIIEEPWEDTVFIFVSDDPGEILPTIFSRTQRVNVPRLSEPEIAGILTSRHAMQPDEANAIARLADGNMCHAIAALDTKGETQEFASLFRDIMRRAYARDVKTLRELADKAAGFGREKICRMLAYFSRMVRENFIYNLGVPELNYMTSDEAQFSSRFAPFINAANVEDIIADFDSASADIARNANAKIVMFDTLLRLIVNIIKKPQG